MELLSFAEDPTQVRWFGKQPFAAICAPNFRIETPAGYPCGYCGEVIAPDDAGVIVRSATTGLHEPYHAECYLRQIIGSVGHIAGWCSCHGGSVDAELDPESMTKRQAARAAVALWHKQQEGRTDA